MGVGVGEAATQARQEGGRGGRGPAGGAARGRARGCGLDPVPGLGGGLALPADLSWETSIPLFQFFSNRATHPYPPHHGLT